MTRIDLAIKTSGEIYEHISKVQCPKFLPYGSIRMDSGSITYDSCGKVSGCRGITCEQCWNEEVSCE